MFQLINIPEGEWLERAKALRGFNPKTKNVCFSFFKNEKYTYISGIVPADDPRVVEINNIFMFFNELIEKHKETHDFIKSCNADNSAYLVPKGHENELSYSGHPEGTIRISDHWSWYANTKKCPDEAFVQCHLRGDKPYPRKGEGLAGETKMGITVAICHDNVYFPITKVIH